MSDNKFQRFNHKYVHCTGDKCEFRSDCIHYLAWQEAVENDLANINIIDHCEDINQGYVRVRIEPLKK